jgi:hypothetical protein
MRIETALATEAAELAEGLSGSSVISAAKSDINI